MVGHNVGFSGRDEQHVDGVINLMGMLVCMFGNTDIGADKILINYMINIRSHAFPTPTTVIVTKEGNLSDHGRKFFDTIHARTGGPSGGPSVSVGLVASGLAQNTALMLTSDWNVVETVAPNTGVIIPTLKVSADVVVFNEGANTLKIYPPIGFAIDAMGPNAPYSLASGKMQRFYCVKSTKLLSSQFG